MSGKNFSRKLKYDSIMSFKIIKYSMLKICSSHPLAMGNFEKLSNSDLNYFMKSSTKD